MGRRRLVTRRRSGTSSVVPVVLLGAAVSLGVVAMTASRFGWRRTKSENAPEEETTDTATETAADTEAPAEDTPREEPRPVPRFKPAPPSDPSTPRWDSPPPELATVQPDPPSP